MEGADLFASNESDINSLQDDDYEEDNESSQFQQQQYDETMDPIKGQGDETKQPQTVDNEDDVSAELWPEYCNPLYVMPEEIMITIPGTTQSFPVKIIKSDKTHKQYLGGFRGRTTGKIFHHAITQSDESTYKRVFKDTSNLRSRDSQTIEVVTLSIQTTCEIGTQMERNDIYLNNKRDIEIRAKQYITAEEVWNLKRLKCIVIQRYWRGFMARRKAANIRQRDKERELAAVEKENLELHETQSRQLLDMKRRLNPRTNSDFQILFNELDAWRKAEVSRIKESIEMTADEKSAALALVLDEEVRALHSIEKLKLAASRELNKENNDRMFELMAHPKLWQLSSGEVAQVQTPETQRAKLLLEIYRELLAPVTLIDSRLNVLLQVKEIVDIEVSKVRDAQSMTFLSDLIGLIDREADLLNRGRPIRSMDKLRLRSSNLYLEFMQNPDFNPRAIEFIGLKKLSSQN